MRMCEMIERTNVASSPCWLWGMNIKDNHWVWFKPRYRVHHHVHVHGCYHRVLSSLSLRLPVSQAVCCLCVDLFSSVLFCSSTPPSLLSLFCLFTLLCPSHPVRHPSFSVSGKKFQLYEIKMVWVLQPYSWLVGVVVSRNKIMPCVEFKDVMWECWWYSGSNNNSECQASGNHIIRDTWRNWPFIENYVWRKAKSYEGDFKNPSNNMDSDC